MSMRCVKCVRPAEVCECIARGLKCEARNSTAIVAIFNPSGQPYEILERMTGFPTSRQAKAFAEFLNSDAVFECVIPKQCRR